MLIIDSHWPNYRQRPNNLSAGYGGSTDQHEVAQLRLQFLKSEYHAHTLLLRRQIRRQQFYDALFLFEAAEQFPQLLLVRIANQVSRALQVDLWSIYVSYQRALAIKCLNRPHQPVVLAAFLLDLLLNFAAQRFQ